MSLTTFKIVALFMCAAFTLGAINDYCVDEAGNDSLECIYENSSQTCCQSLEYVMNTLALLNLTTHDHITIQSNISISGIIEVINFTDLTIAGWNKINIVCNPTETDSGLYFEEVSNLTLMNIIIQRCSMAMKSTTTEPTNSTALLYTLCAVYILNSSNVRLKNTSIAFNYGRGIVLYDVKGNVEISDSIFEGNRVSNDSKYPGGGGLYIEFTCKSFEINTKYCLNSMNESTYSINHNIFRNNFVFEHNPTLTKYSYYHQGSFQGLGRGGGLCIIFNGYSYNNVIEINNCTFLNNSATTWGGGAYISPRNNVLNNTITLTNTHFINNSCTHEGGGGLKVSLLSYDRKSSFNNLHLIDCTFIENEAKTNGGGISMVSSREKVISRQEYQRKNSIMFQNCLWRGNKAKLGSAVDIEPGVWDVLGNGLLPLPTFYNCTFESNFISKQRYMLTDEVEQEISGAGTLLISNFEVVFEEQMIFRDNIGSAIYLQSGIVTLNESCELTISNNTANYGGAMAFIGFSVLYVEENTIIIMKNNMAELKGGAIYTKSVYQHDQHSSRSCFLQSPDRLTDSSVSKRVIRFEGNTAKTNSGNTIYSSSLESCMHNCFRHEEHLLGCAATVEGLEDLSNEISTNTKNFSYNETELQRDMIIPGKYFAIPISSYDEMNQSTKNVYELSLLSETDLNLDDDNSAYLSDQKIRVSGENENNTLVLHKDDTTIYIPIKTTYCPLGHNLDASDICRCDVSYFRGIQKCDKSARTATIINGFWIGRCQKKTQCASFCPPGFCTQDSTIELSTTINGADKSVCAENREGKLCGKCTENHSAYYHSNLNKCGNENLCNFGILFYILSELVPLTIIFLVAIMFNIRFTSGSATGFILYAQILHSLNINIYRVVHQPELLQTIHNVQHFIYSAFNLNFFHLEQLSFCLWRGANTLDILAWNYVTLLYTLFLILLTVWLLNRAMCQKICICWRPHTLKNAVIHGLTAFLVMCYSQSARVSFMILTTARLTGYNQTVIEVVVRFSGENRPFDKSHIIYGLVAVTFICVMVILPPLVLFIYPLCLKFLALCHLSEKECMTKLANKIPMPLFDSFQSCFKDQYRFFSGLYFIYRVVPLLCYMFAPDLVVFYILIEIFLVIILTLHAVLQPYKKTKHNIIDALIFGNLAIVNVLSLLNYQKVTQNNNLEKTMTHVTANTAIQQLFIFLPLICIAIYFTWMFTRCTKTKLKERRRHQLDLKQRNLLDSVYLPPLRSTNITAAINRNYHYHEMTPR